MSSGGRSSLDDVVPVNGNTVATGRAPRWRLRPKLEKTEELRRLSGLEGELGGALSSQGGGECRGVLNLTGEESSTVNLRAKLVGILRLWTGKTRGAIHAGA